MTLKGNVTGKGGKDLRGLMVSERPTTPRRTLSRPTSTQVLPSHAIKLTADTTSGASIAYPHWRIFMKRRKSESKTARRNGKEKGLKT